MAERTLDFRIRLNSDGTLVGELKKADKAVKDLGNEGRSSGRKLKLGMDDAKQSLNDVRRAGQLVGRALAAIGVGIGFKAVIQNTVRQEQALAQLEQRLKSTQGVVGRTGKEIADFAASLQQVTTFGDEAIIEMQNLLLSFTNIRGDVFERTTEAVLDLSVGMNQDLKSAAVQVGKALNDPVRNMDALSRSGLQLNPVQQRLIKNFIETNRVADAQRIILDEISTQFGGSARRNANTFGGALERVSNAFGDILEQKEGLSEATDSINDLAETLSDPQVAEGLRSLIGGATTLAGLGAQLASEFAQFGTSIGETLGSLTVGELKQFDQLRKELEKYQDLRAKSAFSRGVTLFGKDGLVKFYDDKELDLLIAATKTKLELIGKPVVAETPKPKKEDDNSTDKPYSIGVDTEGVAKARSQAAIAQLKQTTQAAIAELDRLRELDLIGADEYFKRRLVAEQGAVDELIKLRRQALAVADSQADREKILADIRSLEQQRAELAKDADHQVLLSRKALTEELLQLQQRLLQAQGQTGAADLLGIETEFKATVQRLTAAGDAAGLELAQRLFRTEVARTQLDDMVRQFEAAQARMRDAESRIQVELDAGLLTQSEAAERIVQLHQATAAELQKQIPLMDELANILGPQAQDQVRRFGVEIAGLSVPVNAAFKAFKDRFKGAFADAFTSITSGAKTAREAIEDFGRSIVNIINQRIGEKLADQFTQFLFPSNSPSGGGGLMDFLGPIFAGVFHGGGMVGGSSGGRRVSPLVFAGAPRYHSGSGILGLKSDEVPAILQTGERVQSREEVRNGSRGPMNVTVIVEAVDHAAANAMNRGKGQLAYDIGQQVSRATQRNG